MRKERKRKLKEHFKNQNLNQDETKEESYEIPKEDIDAHPELTIEVTKEKKPMRAKMHRYMPKEMVERFNKKSYTYLIMVLAIILGVVNIIFGILGILAIFGFRENYTWKIYEKLEIFGWNQLKITGFILIIIGIVMLWSVPFYFYDKTQQADSYLVIATGIGTLFGFIYVLIIIADILNAVVLAITEQSSVSIITYFYLPIILAITTIPLFRILIIRHMVVLPDVGKDAPLNRWSKFYHERKKWHGRHGWKKDNFRWRSSHRKYWRKDKKED